MYGVWKGELINGSGYSMSPRPRPWVARITDFDPMFGLKREFVKGVYDYTHARKSGGRGIWVYFHLAPGHYEVFRAVSWKHEERYFINVDNAGDVQKITREELECHLKNIPSE